MREDQANLDQKSDESGDKTPKKRKPRRSPWLWVAGLGDSGVGRHRVRSAGS